jgi:DNA-binding transcriptional MerR regulator
MADTSAPAPTGAAPAAPAAAAAAPAGGQSITPNANPSAEGLLRQADSLTEKLMETQKRLQAAEAKAAQEAEERRRAEVRWNEYSTNYAKLNQPRGEAYVKHMEEKGVPLDDATKQMYLATFTKPEHEVHANRFWTEMQQDLKVAASRKAQDEKLAAMEAEQKRLQDALNKATQTMSNGLRANYADALAAATPGPETTSVNVAASAGGRPALPPGHVFVQPPSAPELSFLREAGISGGFSVTASNATTGEPELRAMKSSVPVAASHGLMFDPESKEMNFPYSMRHVHPALFGWLAGSSGLVHADVSHLTHVTDSKIFRNEEQRVDGGFAGVTTAPVNK